MNNQVYQFELTFNANDKIENPIKVGEYESCRFINCDFSDDNFSDFKFYDCEFLSCNLSMVKISQTAFRDVIFKDCKMLGLHFENCNEFGLAFRFDHCILNYSSFYKLKLKKTIFKNSQIQEVDFTECDLTASIYDNCDLQRSTFVHSILEKADFRSAYNYSIDPDINKIKKAKFSLNGIAGLLEKYNIEIE